MKSMPSRQISTLAQVDYLKPFTAYVCQAGLVLSLIMKYHRPIVRGSCLKTYGGGGFEYEIMQQ